MPALSKTWAVYVSYEVSTVNLSPRSFTSRRWWVRTLLKSVVENRPLWLGLLGEGGWPALLNPSPRRLRHWSKPRRIPGGVPDMVSTRALRTREACLAAPTG